MGGQSLKEKLADLSNGQKKKAKDDWTFNEHNFWKVPERFDIDDLLEEMGGKANEQ